MPASTSLPSLLPELLQLSLKLSPLLCPWPLESPLSEYFGLAFGSCVTAGGYAIGAVSGGSLNPAVFLGIGISGTIAGGAVINCVIYSIFEIIGGLIAAGVFMATHPSEYSKAGSADETAPVTAEETAA